MLNVIPYIAFEYISRYESIIAYRALIMSFKGIISFKYTLRCESTIAHRVPIIDIGSY